MTQFLTQDSLIPPYMAFPRFLLDKEGLSETAKILYTILLDRTRLSQKNDGWTDDQGHVFIRTFCCIFIPYATGNAIAELI